jgi:hypothetical protein
MWGRTRQMRALLWPLFDRSVWAQPATLVTVTTVEGAFLESVRFDSVGSPTVCGGELDSLGHCSGLCSLGWRGGSQSQWWRARQAKALIWHLFYLSASSQPHNVVAGTAIRALKSTVFPRSELPQPATVVVARKLRALLWPLIAWCAWDQPGTAVLDTKP